MDNVKTKQKFFLRFLKENGILSKFVKNYKQEEERIQKEYKRDKMTFARFFEKISLEDFIYACFNWGYTKEGRVFWVNIQNEWDNFYNTYENRGEKIVYKVFERKKLV